MHERVCVVGAPHLPTTEKLPWPGGAACRVKGNKQDLCPVLGSDTVAILRQLVISNAGCDSRVAGKFPYPPVFKLGKGRWTFVPCCETNLPVALITLAADTHLQYIDIKCDVSNGVVSDHSSGWFGLANGNKPPGTVHKVISEKVAQGVFGYAAVHVPDLQPGDVVWMLPGTPICITGSAMLGCWWSNNERNTRTIWDTLLSPSIQGRVHIINFDLLKPPNSHNYEQCNTLNDPTQFAQRDALFPIALPTELPWHNKSQANTLADIADVAAVATPIVPSRNDETRPQSPNAGSSNASVSNAGTTTPSSNAVTTPLSALEKAVEQLVPTAKQQGLLRDIWERKADGDKVSTEVLSSLQVRLQRLLDDRKPAMDINAFYHMLDEIRTALQSPRNEHRRKEAVHQELVAAMKAAGKEMEAAYTAGDMTRTWDEDNRVRFLYSQWKKGARAADEAIAEVDDDYDRGSSAKRRENKTAAAAVTFSSHGSKKRCAACGSSEIIYANGQSKDCFYSGLTVGIDAAGAHQLMEECKALPIPGDYDGRKLPAEYRRKIERLVSIANGDTPENSPSSPPAANPKQKKRKAEEYDEEDIDDDEEGDDCEVEEEEEDEEEEESDGGSYESDFVSPSGEEEEAEALDSGEDQASVPKRYKMAETILQTELKFPVRSVVDKMKKLWHLGDDASLTAIQVEADLLAALPVLYELRRGRNVFPNAYETREDAELKLLELNRHLVDNLYEVYERETLEKKG